MCQLRDPPSNLHSITSGNSNSPVLERSLTLARSDVIVGVTRSAMEGPRGHTDADREFVQFLDAICHEVGPRITVLPNLGVVNVHHLLFSSRSLNLASCGIGAGASFPGAVMAEDLFCASPIKAAWFGLV